MDFDTYILTCRRAKIIQRSLGIRFAAGYLRNRNLTLQFALRLLLGVNERHL